MTDHRWTSIHKFRLIGLFQITWAQWMLAGFFLGLGIMLLFVPMKANEETLGRYTAAVIIVGSLGGMHGPVAQFVGRVSAVRADDEGLAWIRLGREESRRWDEVVEVYRTEKHVLVSGGRPSEWNRRTDLKVVFDDGTSVQFNHTLSRYSELADAIQTVTAEQLLPGALALVDDPGMTFGPVRIDGEKLIISGSSIPWERLARVAVGGGFFFGFEGPYQHRSVALEQIPNYRLMLVLLAEMGVRVGSGASA